MGIGIANRREAERKEHSMDEWYSCIRKRAYEVESEASGACHKLNQGRTDGTHVYNVYECQYGKHFHVGRTFVEKKKRRRRRTEDAGRVKPLPDLASK